MSRFIEHSMNLDTVKHSQDASHFRTEGVYVFSTTYETYHDSPTKLLLVNFYFMKWNCHRPCLSVRLSAFLLRVYMFSLQHMKHIMIINIVPMAAILLEKIAKPLRMSLGFWNITHKYYCWKCPPPTTLLCKNHPVMHGHSWFHTQHGAIIGHAYWVKFVSRVLVLYLLIILLSKNCIWKNPVTFKFSFGDYFGKISKIVRFCTFRII